MNESLQTALRKLRLSGLASSLDIRLQEAASHQLNHLEFLKLILQDELAVRADRLMDRRIKAASFRDAINNEGFNDPKWATLRHTVDMASKGQLSHQSGHPPGTRSAQGSISPPPEWHAFSNG